MVCGFAASHKRPTIHRYSKWPEKKEAMQPRGYQENFSAGMQSMYDRKRREKKAHTMRAVLQDHFGSRLDRLDLIDVGASTGAIPHALARSFRTAVGIDIDRPALGHAVQTLFRPNLFFAAADAMDLCFAAECFDVVICAQVYEHVPDADSLMAEIHRVLKPGGVCYFAAGNRLQVMEPHYRLPFLSWLPRSLSHRYVRLTGKAPFYYERHLFYPGLKRLVRHFRRIDYTAMLIENPSRYGLSYMLPEGKAKTKLARLVVRYFYPLCPGYIWLLEKSYED